MDSMHLILLHMELECIGIDEARELVRIPGPSPDTIHRVYVARHDKGDSIFFRPDVPKAIRKRLLALPVSDFFEVPERVKAILSEDQPCQETHIGKSYTFAGEARPSLHPDVVRLSQIDLAIVRRNNPGYDPYGGEVFAVMIGDEIASTCQSSRENEKAGEAWVQTVEKFRRRGFARQVTAAWGNWLLQQGKVPFYSHRWENFASQSVAQSLGLVQYLADAGYA